LETVLVLDFGAQYSQLIARRVRELRVYCEIVPHTVSVEEIKARDPKGIIFTGGPRSVYGDGAPRLDEDIYGLGIPILGICYGLQLLTYQLGGAVEPAEKREYGRAELLIDDDRDLFAGFKTGEADREAAWMSHGDYITEPAPGFDTLAHTDHCPIAAVGHRGKKIYGVQFHPEVAHTPRGREVLQNFLYHVCGCNGQWTMESFVDTAVEAVRAQVGEGQVVCGLSGGIDSSVAAALVHRAVSDQLTCIYVDHGFMRKGETEQVLETFGRDFQMKLIHVDARERFLQKVRGISDPEIKRKRIGNEFIRVFEEEAAKVGQAAYLVQGTLYPDIIESGTEQAAVIKSHHNVGGLPEEMDFELVEPLKALFKDEVRALAMELGLPDEIVWRHPFPGPGLAIRIMGEITGEKLDLLREVDHIFIEEIRRAGLYKEIWQAFAVLTNTRTVGVMGDERTYDYVAALRAVASQDGMTSDWYRVPPDVLEIVSRRIMNEIQGVNRVVYDISSKPPATIEWE